MFNLDAPSSPKLIPMTEAERSLYELVVPEDDFFRRLSQAIDFASFLPVLATAYSPNQGRPPLEPVVLLKLEVLARHYGYSDRELMRQARVNMAYRLFLGLSLLSPLPHPTLMTYSAAARKLPEIPVGGSLISPGSDGPARGQGGGA